ncbi:MAG: glycosyltransferase family 2 protein [Candidatus Paceibacterota bacterium]|jgi:glycosyltransferase involved in cell wall biosynthesis
MTGEKTFNLIVMAPFYNERKWITEWLRNVEQFADGIIMLDDGSTDGGAELCISDKLLCPVIRIERNDPIEFRELLIRNMLIKESDKYTSKWIMFLDLDEKIHWNDTALIKKDMEEGIYDEFSILSYWVYPIWNTPTTYRVTGDIPPPYTYWRTWKQHKGAIIRSARDYHFGAHPYQMLIIDGNPNFGVTKWRLLHYTNLDKENRIRRYHRYTTVDKDADPTTYLYLLDEDKDIVLKQIPE